MNIQTRSVEYKDGDTVLEAYMAWDDTVTGSCPGVMVSHAWAGRSEFDDRKAERLAELGYVGFAIDLYGKGVSGSNPEENSALMQPLMDDRETLQRRMHLALAQLSAQKEVDGSRVAAIGFCFGGLCVLDLARTGADVRGVVSFHGLLGAPDNTENSEMTAKVLVLHGWRDPHATPDQVLSFADEMTARGADWELQAYGNALHSFTNPDANDPDNGVQFDAHADHRSWDSMWMFLNEVFALPV
jgi:dienelactone hydrolase